MNPNSLHTLFISISTIFAIRIIVQIGWVDFIRRGINDVAFGSDVIAASVPVTFTTSAKTVFIG
jgi:hypothetical protein